MVEKPRFSGQLDDETVIIYERRHWFTIIKWIWGRPLLLLPISLVIAWAVTTILPVTALVGLAYWLVILSPALTWIVWRALDWENDHYIITNKRVIHRERVYFLSEERKEAYLDKVQDVAIEIVNPFANVLNFGDVVIETASKAGIIKFQAISKPHDVQRLLLESAGLPPKKGDLTPQPRRWLLGRGIWRMLYPTYPTEEEGVIIWRKHWWVLNSDLILSLLAIFVLVTVWLWALTSLSYPGWVNVLFALGLAGIAIWIAFKTIDWHNDLYILTKDRVIDIEKKPFVFEHRREANLATIQDVSLEQIGFTAKMLDFGNVLLKTAGRAGEFTFDSVAHPKEVQATIAARMNEFRQNKRLAEQEKQRATTVIVAIVEDYLRQTEGEEKAGRRAEIISVVDNYLRLEGGEVQEERWAEIISMLEDYLRRRGNR